MDGVFEFLGWLITIIFFIWFGRTMNAIKRNTAAIAEAAKRAADHAEHQTRTLAEAANQSGARDQ